MKTLYLARHAKSDWGQSGYSDFDRPLNDQGLVDAHAMKNYLAAADFKVDAIVSSSAMRAITTAGLYAEKILETGEIFKLDKIYEADEQDVLNIINNISNDFQSLMLVGHNPALSVLVDVLSGEAVNMSSGSIVELRIDLDDWAAINSNSARLVRMLTPANISSK